MFSIDIRPSNEHKCVPQSSTVINCINPIYSNETEKYINGKDMNIMLPKHSICARDSSNDSVFCITDLETFANIKLNKQYDTEFIMRNSSTSNTSTIFNSSASNTSTIPNNSTSQNSFTANGPTPNDNIIITHQQANMTYNPLAIVRTLNETKNIVDDCKYNRKVLIEPHYIDTDSKCTNGKDIGLTYGPKESSKCVLPNQEKEYVCALSCRYDKEIKNAQEKYCRSWKKIDSRDVDVTDNNLNIINSNEPSLPISDEILTVLTRGGRNNMNIIESDCINSTCNIDKCTIPNDKVTVLEIENNGTKTYWKHDPPEPDPNTLTRITDYCNTSDTTRVSCRDKCISLS